MGKNDWDNNEAGVRSSMNQPYWLASGVVSGDDIVLAVTPGSVRYFTGLCHSGQAQQLTLGDFQGSTVYHIFARSDCSFMVSGTAGGGDDPTVPEIPRWDAEHIGTVRVDGSNNLTGPWNQEAFQKYEGRGQYTAPTRPRFVVIDSADNADGAVTAKTEGTASGIMIVTPKHPMGIGRTTPTRKEYLRGARVAGVIQWMPSGTAGGGTAYRQTLGYRLRATIGGSTTTFQTDHFDTVEVGAPGPDPDNDTVPIYRRTPIAAFIWNPSGTAGDLTEAWIEVWTEANNDTNDTPSVRVSERSTLQVSPTNYIVRRDEFQD